MEESKSNLKEFQFIQSFSKILPLRMLTLMAKMWKDLFKRFLHNKIILTKCVQCEYYYSKVAEAWKSGECQKCDVCFKNKRIQGNRINIPAILTVDPTISFNCRFILRISLDIENLHYSVDDDSGDEFLSMTMLSAEWEVVGYSWSKYEQW